MVGDVLVVPRMSWPPDGFGVEVDDRDPLS